MNVVRASLFFVVLFFCVEFYQCRRIGGGGGRRIGGSSSSYSRPSYRPSVHYPAPRPSPRPPVYHPAPRPSPHPAPRPSPRPTSHYPAPRPSPPPTSRPNSRPPTNNPRPRPSTHYPAPAPHPRPSPPPRYPGSSPRPSRYPTVGSGKKNSDWVLPPKPGSTNYHTSHVSQTIIYKPKYYNHGQYSLPVQSRYPGYYYSPYVYPYSVHDTGSTALGFYLGYSLGHLSTPTYTHQRFFDGYSPRYDHYTVHHYYHNRDSIPPTQEIRSNKIVQCVGDSVTVCPTNTTSLCTSEGTLMCVVSATSTVPCTDNRQVNCIKSTISCENNTAPECKNAKSTSISIPCISSAQVYGDIKYVNNSIVLDKPINTTNVTTTNSNSTINGNTTVAATLEYSTKYPITTTPTPETQTIPNNTVSRKKRETPHNFCVTIVALPAKRQETEGERAFNGAGKVFSNFIESAWGL